MKKNRSMLLVFAFVATAFIFEYAFLAPKSDMLADSIDTRYKTLLKDEQFLRTQGKASGGAAAAIEETKKLEGRLLGGKTEFLAAATLEGQVMEFASDAGLTVLTVRPLAAEKLGNYTVISLYFEGGGSIKQLSDFLKKIEDSKVLIKISKLSINITNIQTPNDLKYKIQVASPAKL